MKKYQFYQEVCLNEGMLSRFALKFAKNEENAKDLTQETMLRAISNFERFKEGTNLKAWLYTIMKNLFINHYRKNNQRRVTVFQVEDITSQNLYQAATKNLGIDAFIKEDLEKALSSLSSKYYEPFMMYFEGYKYYEIADQLDIPIGTVKTRIHLARKLLIRKLKPYSYA